MNTKYIVRFDDICPDCNWKIINEIEKILDDYSLTAIIAVIPNNQDNTNQYQNPIDNYFQRIQNMKNKGWTIALHGYDHVYVNNKAGILGLSRHSEFVGIPYSEQELKINKGLKLLSDNGLKIDTWIAPSHSFDLKTIKALRNNGISYISDGHSRYPFSWLGMKWVPCQLWGYPDKNKKGIYTICLHPNTWDDYRVKMFAEFIKENHQYICSFDDIKNTDIGFIKNTVMVLDNTIKSPIKLAKSIYYSIKKR